MSTSQAEWWIITHLLCTPSMSCVIFLVTAYLALRQFFCARALLREGVASAVPRLALRAVLGSAPF